MAIKISDYLFHYFQCFEICFQLKFINFRKLKHKKEKEDSDDSSSEEESSNSESEMQVDKQEFNKTKRARLAYDMTDSRKEEPENDMNKLLSSKTDWVKWCSSLSLK